MKKHDTSISYTDRLDKLQKENELLKSEIKVKNSIIKDYESDDEKLTDAEKELINITLYTKKQYEDGLKEIYKIKSEYEEIMEIKSKFILTMINATYKEYLKYLFHELRKTIFKKKTK